MKVRMPLLLNVRTSFEYPIGLESNYPSLLNNFPEPLGSSIDKRELVLQCMIAFDTMIRQ